MSRVEGSNTWEQWKIRLEKSVEEGLYGQANVFILDTESPRASLLVLKHKCGKSSAEAQLI